MVVNSTAQSTVHFVQPRTIECNYLDLQQVICNGTVFGEMEEKLDPSGTLFWVYLGIYIVLVLFAGLMAGLTIAILSLDMTSLKVLEAAGTDENRRYAKRILPLVNRRHLVLVTLVLANAASVEAMPIFMDRISDPITAVLVSSTAVLIFGEVLPQAICSRYGLKVGYFMAWLVWGLVGLFFVISLPFSYLLDMILGKESGTYYGRKELEALVDIHGPKQKQHEDHGRKGFAACGRDVKLCTETLSVDEVLIIKGALTMTNKIASTAMVKLDDVFMLSIDTIFDEPCLKMIFELGHSRIPVYEANRKNILGVFLTKRLIAIDPNQKISLKQLIDESTAAERKAFYQGLRVNENMHMYELLNRFQTGTLSHMAFVTSKMETSDTEEIIGIVTLEDVIEELLQEEIFDEADVKREMCKNWLPTLPTTVPAAQKVTFSYRQKSLIPSKAQAEVAALTEKIRAGRTMSVPSNKLATKRAMKRKHQDLTGSFPPINPTPTCPNLDLVDESEETEEEGKEDTENYENNKSPKKGKVNFAFSTEQLSAADLKDTADDMFHKEKLNHNSDFILPSSI